MKYDKILIFGIPGSGNTVIGQILRYLFNSNIIWYTHNYIDNLEDNRNIDPNINLGIIISLRDFRSVLASTMRKINLLPNIDNINEIYQTRFKPEYNNLFQYKTNYPKQENILYMDYKKSYRNFYYIFEQLENFLDIRISTEDKKSIINKFNIDANKKISDKLKIWDMIDKTTDIHGNHIWTGEPNSWKYFFPKELHDYVTNILKSELKTLGLCYD